MLFLPGIQLCLEEFETEFKFVVDDDIYFLFEENSVWEMRSVNTRTCKLSSVQVNVEDEDERGPLTDFYHTVVVHDRKTYLWNYEEQYLLEGSHDNEGFHWHNVETTGDPPDIGISFGFTEGTTSYYGVIQTNDNEGILYLYRLNLATFNWSREAIPQPVQDVVNTIAVSPLRNWHWDVLDLTSLETSVFPYEKHSEDPAPMFCRNSVFVFEQDLWMFGIKQRSEEEKLTLYRFEMETQKWIEVGTPSGGPVSAHIREPTTVGSRVIFMTPCRILPAPRGMTQKLVYVLDFEPSLLDRAAVALVDDPSRIEQARRTLPVHIVADLIERRILPVEEGDQKGKEDYESKMEDKKEEDDNNEEEDDGEIPPKRNRVE